MTRLVSIFTAGVAVAVLSALVPAAHACAVNVYARANVAAMTLYTFNDSDPICWAYYNKWSLNPNSSVQVSCNGNSCQISQNVDAGCPYFNVPCNNDLIYYIDSVTGTEMSCYAPTGAAQCDTARNLFAVEQKETATSQESSNQSGSLRGTTAQP